MIFSEIKLHCHTKLLSLIFEKCSYLLEEGRNGSPKMMSVGLHCRLVGRPGRAAGLSEFLDYAKSFDDVWICTREEIANHFYEHHYPEKEL